MMMPESTDCMCAIMAFFSETGPILLEAGRILFLMCTALRLRGDAVRCMASSCNDHGAGA